MARLDDLLARIDDPALREALGVEVGSLRRRQTFGLSFERHLPETLTLPDAIIRPGVRVARKDDAHRQPLVVDALSEGMARCRTLDGETEDAAVCDLVVIKAPGEPVYPALDLIDRVAGPDQEGAPNHVLIEGENYHVLQMLNWLYAGKVDCIYIDPPYNTGAKDWKYNNDYVDRNDAFRHSKWLSMMHRRLKLAKPLLKEDGVLIVTIDENELATLRLLLGRDDLFKGWEIQIVSIVHNPKGIQGDNFAVSNEFALFVIPPGRKLINPRRLKPGESLIQNLRKWGNDSLRTTARNCFYPIYFRDGRFDGAGDVAPDDVHPPARTRALEDGRVEFWPIDAKGEERKWRYARQTVEEIAHELRLAPGRDGLEVKQVKEFGAQKTVWQEARYSAANHGTELVSNLAGAPFPFPKALYATFDCVEAVCRNRPDALVLDFFSGSGTTVHAVALMNALDGGRRRGIAVTNNEVGAEAPELLKRGLKPGDDEWEARGICRSVTFPRLRNSLLGRLPDNTPLAGRYLTGRYREEATTPEVVALAFTSSMQTKDAAARRSLANLIGVASGALAKADGYYIAAETTRDRIKNQAILLDPDALEPFIAALTEGGDHIERVSYVPPRTAAEQRHVEDAIIGALGVRTRPVEIERPISDGLPGALAYLRLGFLDPHAVEVGNHLEDLLPSLWLMAGGVGPLPTMDAGSSFLVAPVQRLALLADEAEFRTFRAAVEATSEIEWVFIITDAEEAFLEMSALLPDRIVPAQKVRLYRQYLDNFRINTDRQ